MRYHRKMRVVTAATWRWLCVRYFIECTKYKRLDKRAQHFRTNLESTYDKPTAPDRRNSFEKFCAHFVANASGA
jgi:hypothetical protein